MSAKGPRPIGVVVVFILLLITGVVSLLGGLLELVGASQVGSAAIQGVTVNQPMLFLLGGGLVIVGILDILFAIGVFRGSRVARMIVTILQVIGIIGAIGSLVTGGAVWSGVYNIAIPAAIIVMMWVGEATKAFFAKK